MNQHGDEAALISRAKGGDRTAQETLWSTNRRWVAAIIMAHRSRSVEIEDLMQDVAVKFVSKIRTLRDAGAFRPWLRQIAINACRGSARRARPAVRIGDPERLESGEVSPPASTRERGSHTVEHRDAAEKLYRQVLTLPSEYAEPLLMRCLHEMSYQQISDILELPVTTVETRLARARRMLREEMGTEGLADGIQ